MYAQANIRGGGEFGPRWHQAALKERRHKAYEDFEAVAADLVRRRITCPKKLAIQGGSNGGLLTGNMLVRSPHLFGAVLCQVPRYAAARTRRCLHVYMHARACMLACRHSCLHARSMHVIFAGLLVLRACLLAVVLACRGQVPLLDMYRYSKLLAGASWMGEFGNPEVAEEWAFLKRYSPYHRLRRTTQYPPILLTTSTRDDRVVRLATAPRPARATAAADPFARLRRRAHSIPAMPGRWWPRCSI